MNIKSEKQSRIKGCGAIIENYNGTLLLHLRDENAPTLKNQWCLVGGRTKENESDIEALIREVKEETNLEITDIVFLKKFKRYDNNATAYIYHAKTDTRNQKMKVLEGKDLKFMTREKILALLKTLDYTNQYLETLAEFINNKEKLK